MTCVRYDCRLLPWVSGRGLCFKAVSSGVSFSEEESLVSLIALAFRKHKE